MSIKIQLVNKERKEDITEWENFLLRVNDGNILQSRLIADAFTFAGFDWKVVVARRNKEIVGGTLLTIFPGKGKFRPLRRFSTFKTAYGPVCIKEDKGIVIKILRKIEEYAAKYKAMQSVIITKHTWIHEALNRLRYRTNAREVGCTFLVDLQRSEKQLWKGMSKGTYRKPIRKAENYGIWVREVSDSSAPKIMHELHSKNFERLGIASYPLSFFEGIWECSTKENGPPFFFAYYQGEPIAGLVILAYKNTIYDYLAGAVEKGFELDANKLLKWYAIRWGKEQGYALYDLLFAPSDRRSTKWGIYIYKKRLGGREIPIYYHVRNHSLRKQRIWYNVILPAYNFLRPVSALL